MTIFSVVICWMWNFVNWTCFQHDIHTTVSQQQRFIVQKSNVCKCDAFKWTLSNETKQNKNKYQQCDDKKIYIQTNGHTHTKFVWILHFAFYLINSKSIHNVPSILWRRFETQQKKKKKASYFSIVCELNIVCVPCVGLLCINFVSVVWFNRV